MKRALNFIFFFLCNFYFSFAQYNPELWIVDNQTDNVESVVGLDNYGDHTFDTNPVAANVWTTDQYKYEWVQNGKVLKVTFTNNQSPNYKPMGLSMLQWQDGGQSTLPKFKPQDNSAYQSAVGLSVDFSNPDNAEVSFEVIASDDVFVRIDCQSVDGKVTTDTAIGVLVQSTPNIDLNDQSQWHSYTYSWGGRTTADAYTTNLYDLFSPAWHDVINPHAGIDTVPIDKTAIVGINIVLDHDDYAQGNYTVPVTKYVYFKNFKIGASSQEEQYFTWVGLPDLQKSNVKILDGVIYSEGKILVYSVTGQIVSEASNNFSIALLKNGVYIVVTQEGTMRIVK